MDGVVGSCAPALQREFNRKPRQKGKITKADRTRDKKLCRCCLGCKWSWWTVMSLTNSHHYGAGLFSPMHINLSLTTGCPIRDGNFSLRVSEQVTINTCCHFWNVLHHCHSSGYFIDNCECASGWWNLWTLWHANLVSSWCHTPHLHEFILDELQGSPSQAARTPWRGCCCNTEGRTICKNSSSAMLLANQPPILQCMRLPWVTTWKENREGKTFANFLTQKTIVKQTPGGWAWGLPPEPPDWLHRLRTRAPGTGNEQD